MSFGFLGIQYGFGLQQANMSPIFRYLHADEANIPILWLAGPVTGLIVQPIIGSLSDRSWSQRWGRRKPFFLIGALISSFAMIIDAQFISLWMAARLMWMLDAGLNSAMEPFRAFMAISSTTNNGPRLCHASFFVGFGQTLANLMPHILPLFGRFDGSRPAANGIPDFVRYPFYIGAAAYCAVFWTMRTTKEYPPEDLTAFEREKSESKGIMGVFGEIGAALRDMPPTMKQLWWVKFFTWYGLPLMWQYLSLALPHAFNAPTPESPGFEKGIEVGNDCFAMFNIWLFQYFVFSARIANRLGRRATHATIPDCWWHWVSYPCSYLEDRNVFLIGMTIVGLAWGSILSMPYVMLSCRSPKNVWVFTWAFSMALSCPQIIDIHHRSSTFMGRYWAMTLAMRWCCAGVCLLLAAAACFLVKETKLSEEIRLPS